MKTHLHLFDRHTACQIAGWIMHDDLVINRMGKAQTWHINFNFKIIAIKYYSLFFFILLLMLFSFQKQTTAQELWGMTAQGGTNNLGVIFKTDANGNNQNPVYSFTIDYEGRNPILCNLIQASNGKLYGMTQFGGSFEIGVLFEFDPVTGTYIKKLDFDGTDKGMSPLGSLIQATNGKLYGMTPQGGSSGIGVLFEFDPITNTYTKKLDFDGTNKGMSPLGSLMQATNGKLYGMTQLGGSLGCGVLFEYDPVTDTYTKKLDFDGLDKGSYPSGSLMQATNGKLYGMTGGGGSSSVGVLFEYDPVTDTYTKKLDFDGISKGSTPYGSLMQATNGKLYGMTSGGGTSGSIGNSGYGVLFEYDPVTDTYSKKLDFDGLDKGSYPSGSLMQATNGKLYGMTSQGGSSIAGVLFEYDLASNTYTKKLDFDGLDKGSYPQGSLMQATNGKLYGMTSQGGSSGCGVLFEYDPVSYTYTKKMEFNGTSKGRSPYGALIQTTTGKLYGMAGEGGIFGYGVLFELDPNTNICTKKLDFDGFDKGSYPYGSLMQATNGKLYGMTERGGTSDYGVLFEFDPTNGFFTKKLDFDGTSKGSIPYGSLMQATNGKLYGLTSGGGSSGYGILFQFDPVTNTYTKKLDFDGTSKGGSPCGSLMQATNGKLYGLTSGGGSSGFGVLFEFDPVTDTYTKKLDFDGTSKGGSPFGSLMQATNGKLYGMTYRGGTSNFGVLFEYDPITNTYIKKLDFDGINTGSYPEWILMQATNGKLYGMTPQGGSSGYGVLFEFDPITDIYTKKLDFTGNTGAFPYSSLIEVASGEAPIAICQNITLQLDNNGQAILTASQIDGGSSGTDITLSASKTNFTCSDVGQNPVTLTVTDSHGNTSSCNATVTVEFNEQLSANVTIAADANTVCAGTTVTYTATPENGGETPSYQWKLGGEDIEDATSDTYSYIPEDGDEISVVMTSSAECISGSPATSNTIKMSVNPLPTITCPADIDVNVDPDKCGASVIFVATAEGIPAPLVTYKVGTDIIESPYVFPVGTTTVSVEAGNDCSTATCSFKVTVRDNIDPTISAPSNLTANTDPGLCAKTFTLAQIGTPTVNDNCSATVSWTRSDGATNLDSPFLFGLTTITWKATDGAGNTATSDQTVTIEKVTTATTVTVTPSSQQYSDKVTFTANVTNCTLAGTIGGTVEFKVGSQVMGTANVQSDGTATLANVALLEPTPFGTLPTGQLSQGLKTVTANYSGSANYLSSSNTTSHTITPEVAAVTYNGGSFFAANPSTYQGTITPSAFVVDDGDGSRGDIRNATITFRDGSVSGSTLGSLNIPVGLISSSVTTDGSASTSFNYTLSTSDLNVGGKTWEVWTTVGNYYNGQSDAYTPITLGLPGLDYVTGGGNIVMSNSLGIYAGDAGKKMNFGLVMKWNKSGKNLQGNINVIYRRGDGNYQIKSNAINSLVIENVNDNGKVVTGSAITYRRATISTKANFKKLNSDGSSTDLGGNLNLTITAWESTTNKTGALDRIGVQLAGTNGTGVNFSSNWSGGNTVTQQLSGGKIQVQTPITKSAQVAVDVTAASQEPSVKVYPNPFTEKLTLEFSNQTDAHAHLDIYTITGAKLATLFDGNILGGEVNTVEYLPKLISSQMVFYQLLLGEKTYTGKVLYNTRK